MRKNIFSLTMILLSLAATTSQAQEIGDNYKYGPRVFSLPTQRDKESQMLLNFMIPKNFWCAAYTPTDDYLCYLYVPRNEEIENWSEAIAVVLLDKNVGPLEAAIKNMQSQLEATFGSENLNFSITTQAKENDTEWGIVAYDFPAFDLLAEKPIPGQRESVLKKVIIGQDCMYAIMYCIRYENAIAPEALTEKQQKFIDSCTLSPPTPSLQALNFNPDQQP